MKGTSDRENKIRFKKDETSHYEAKLQNFNKKEVIKKRKVEEYFSQFFENF